MRKSFSIGAALMFATAIMSASVTFDPATGTGFVGKGDVQLLFGWNNKQLQDNAASLHVSRTSSGACTKCRLTFTVGNGPRQTPGAADAEPRQDTSLKASVSSTSPASRNQITGFILTGLELHDQTAKSPLTAAQLTRAGSSTRS